MTQDALARKYHRWKRLLSIARYLISLAYFLYLLVGGLTFQIRDWAAQKTGAPVFEVLFYFFVVVLISDALHWPVSVLSGYHVEHRFQLSNQTFRSWMKDYLKSSLLTLALGGALTEFVYWTLRNFPQAWWVVCAIGFVLVAIVLAQLAPVLLFPLFYRFTPLEDATLQARLLRLCEKAQTKVQGVFNWHVSEKSKKANAAFVGLGATRRILLSDTLLKDFSHDEVEVVLAHELGHHVYRDIWKHLLIQSGMTVMTFYLLHRALQALSAKLGFSSISDVANFPLLVGLSGLIGFLAVPLMNSYSRKMERRADAFALEATRLASAFISSMEKLGEKNLAERQPNRWIEFLFHSHPSIARRVAFAERWAAQAEKRFDITSASSPVE